MRFDDIPICIICRFYQTLIFIWFYFNLFFFFLNYVSKNKVSILDVKVRYFIWDNIAMYHHRGPKFIVFIKLNIFRKGFHNNSEVSFYLLLLLLFPLPFLPSSSFPSSSSTPFLHYFNIICYALCGRLNNEFFGKSFFPPLLHNLKIIQNFSCR